MRRLWVKRLLAFAASATVAALLLMRILPELAADPEEKPEPEKAQMQVELSMPDKAADAAPETATALMLPPPPQRTQTRTQTPVARPAVEAPPREAKPVAVAPIVAESPPQAEPKTAERTPESEPAAETTVAKNAAVKAALSEKPRSKVKPVAEKPEPLAEERQITAALSANEKPEPDPLAQPERVTEPPQRVTEPPQRVTPEPEHFVSPGPTVEAEGRVLLRILEHGSGPVIEIAWPVSATRRRALYRLFEACYGMEIAVIDSGGRLFSGSGASGQPWQPNLDRYSGFLRQPSGRLTMDERDSISRIRIYHGGLRAADNVRLFPRRLDALLLGGLKALIGDGYASADAIRARYRRDGEGVLVEGIRLDGRPILGRIDLSAAARRCRTGAWS